MSAVQQYPPLLFDAEAAAQMGGRPSAGMAADCQQHCQLLLCLYCQEPHHQDHRFPGPVALALDNLAAAVAAVVTALVMGAAGALSAVAADRSLLVVFAP
jgi:hypothetical protein